jgi:phospholipid/cholesterol/gamma-HCH transport system substrate-binding protein
MSAYRRNVLVGAMVLGALVILGWMLIQFGGRIVSPFAPATIPVRFVSDRADGISNGSPVVYRGVTVGRVERVTRDVDQLRILIDAALDKQPPLPGNVRAIIRSQGLVGAGALIVLELTDAQPAGTLQPGQTIPTEWVGLDLLPPEFAELATELRLTARQFRESNLVAHVDEQIAKVGRLVDSLQQIADDQQLRDDLKTSLANLRRTTEKADRIATNLEQFSTDVNELTRDTSRAIVDISRQTSDRLQQASKLLDQFQAIAEKINKGQGTAGAIVNDPRLYESLVLTARELSATILDLRRLLEQWEQEGVSLKMK